MQSKFRFPDLSELLRRPPQAVAKVTGNRRHSNLHGRVLFYQTCAGVIVRAAFEGLPCPGNVCRQPVFGFHIHGGGSCTGTAAEPFADADGHYNPHDCPHPYHAGDLPPLFGVGGRALSVFLINRFTVSEILGKTVIVHASPDDFTTQPSGNAGEMMACGEIVICR